MSESGKQGKENINTARVQSYAEKSNNQRYLRGKFSLAHSVMALFLMLLCLIFSVAPNFLLKFLLKFSEQTPRRARNGEAEDEKDALTRIPRRQSRSVGSQPVVNYSGRMNVTAGGRTCQMWSASQPHEH